MELELDSGNAVVDASASNALEIEIPHTWDVLPAAMIDAIYHHSLADKMIVAIGRRSLDGDVDFVTGDGCVAVALASRVPEGTPRILESGHAIAFEDGASTVRLESRDLIGASSTLVKT